eukprot:2016155-Rhodomonas_salina.1
MFRETPLISRNGKGALSVVMPGTDEHGVRGTAFRGGSLSALELCGLADGGRGGGGGGRAESGRETEATSARLGRARGGGGRRVSGIYMLLLACYATASMFLLVYAYVILLVPAYARAMRSPVPPSCTAGTALRSTNLPYGAAAAGGARAGGARDTRQGISDPCQRQGSLSQLPWPVITDQDSITCQWLTSRASDY